MYNPYRILGVPDNSSTDDCKRAFRRLAARWHPDNPNGDADKFDEIRKAWETIQSGQVLGDVRVKRTALRHASLFRFV